MEEIGAGLGCGEDLHTRIAVPSAEIYMLCGCWHDMRLSSVLGFVCQTPFSRRSSECDFYVLRSFRCVIQMIARIFGSVFPSAYSF